MLTAGIIVMLVGGGLVWLSSKQKKASDLMRQTKAVPIRELQAGTLSEASGTVTIGQPLVTPFSKRECAYYEYEIEREVPRRDTDGRTRFEWDTVEEDKKMAPFVLKDQTGSIAVNPEGASIQARDLGEQRFRRGERFDAGVFDHLRHELRDTNIRISEKALLTDETAYVFGMVSSNSQGLEFNKVGKDFLISCRSEEEVEKSTARTATVLKVLGIMGVLVGVFMAISSL